MARQPKPAHWVIFPGRGFLKSSDPLVSEVLVNTGQSGSNGMTQTDKSDCETFAWRHLLSSLATRYDVSNWGADPPDDLEYYWKMLASAYYRIMELGPAGADRREEAMVPIAWIKHVQRDLARIADPSDEGLNLMGSDGDIIRPRTGILAPCVGSVGLTLFPGMDDESSGSSGNWSVGGSLEEFQKIHGWLSQTSRVDGFASQLQDYV